MFQQAVLILGYLTSFNNRMSGRIELKLSLSKSAHLDNYCSGAISRVL